MNQVRLSVRLSDCRHLGALLCTDGAPLSFDGFCFHLAHGKNIYWSRAKACYFYEKSKKWNFGEYLKNGDFGDLA